MCPGELLACPGLLFLALAALGLSQNDTHRVPICDTCANWTPAKILAIFQKRCESAIIGS